MTNDEKFEYALKLEADLKAAMAAGDKDEVERLRLEAGAMLVENGGVRVEEIEKIAAMMDAAVNVAIAEVLEVAHILNQDAVPVSVLQELMTMPKTASQMFWKQADEIPGLINYGTPDDISSLMGDS